MKNKVLVLALLFLLSFAFGARLAAQTYDYTCYCATTGSTPDNIVQLDNNEQLLLALVRPQTLAQLKEGGLSFNQSQIRLLADWQLLKEAEGVYRTAFPILDAGKTAVLRQRMRQHAAAACGQLAAVITGMKKILAGQGREKTVYTILFSYVLDNLVWEQWENEKVLKALENTVEYPLLNGTFWASTPKRALFCGTNSISDKGYSLKINWAPPAIPLMKPFITDWKNQMKMFAEFANQGKVTDAGARAAFGPFRIFDAGGCPTVPTITESPADPLYKCSLELATIISAQVLQDMKADNLMNLAGGGDEGAALVIAYHEWMWEFLDECERRGLLEKPDAFAHPEKASAADVGDLVFLVKSIPPAPEK
jgi:hypothetical protein